LGQKRRAAAGVAGDGAEERVAGVEHGWEGGARASAWVECTRKSRLGIKAFLVCWLSSIEWREVRFMG
jgi:hypothetical protein